MADSNENVARLVPGKPDHELAGDFRRELDAVLIPLLEIMTRYQREHGFTASFNIATDWSGRAVLTQPVAVVKNL